LEISADGPHRWADGGRTAQAACWFVFLEQYGKAVDVLMKSKGEVLSEARTAKH
jgi:hypothetical protein